MAMDQLHFPELVWKEAKECLPVEIAIDFLPAAYEDGNWQRGIHEVVAKWVAEKKFAGTGTLWTWTTLSINLASRHPQYAMPTMNEFVVQFGFPAWFEDYLKEALVAKFNNQVGSFDIVAPRRDDGWMPICHVEQGRVWKCVDADLWEPFVPVKPARKGRTAPKSRSTRR
jgi:hypothetical protein